LPALAAGASAGCCRGKRRLELSRAKHRSLAGHARMAKRVAALIPGYAYDEAGFFGSDVRRPTVAAAPRRLRAPERGFTERYAERSRPRRRRAHAARPAVHRQLPVPFQYSPICAST
jgi:glutamate-1-semialdehyde 2,1-aminomutase